MIITNPDCRDGKHRSCSGVGWDDINGEPCACPCECHKPAKRTTFPTGDISKQRRPRKG